MDELAYEANSAANLGLRLVKGQVRTSTVEVTCDIHTSLPTRKFVFAGGKNAKTVSRRLTVSQKAVNWRRPAAAAPRE